MTGGAFETEGYVRPGGIEVTEIVDIVAAGRRYAIALDMGEDDPGVVDASLLVLTLHPLTGGDGIGVGDVGLGQWEVRIHTVINNIATCVFVRFVELVFEGADGARVLGHVLGHDGGAAVLMARDIPLET